MPPRPPPRQQPPPYQENSAPIDDSHRLLTSFNAFLTVCVHNILYYRSVYPKSTFLSTRAYNLPVHQNRHPKVCDWITDSIKSIAAQLPTGQVSNIVVVIHSPFYPSPSFPHVPSSPPSSPSSSYGSYMNSFSSSSSSQQKLRPPPGGSVLERYLIDVSNFPRWYNPSASAMVAAMGPTEAMTYHNRILTKEARAEVTRDVLVNNPRHPGINFVDVDQQFRATLLRMAHTMESLAPLPEGCTFTMAIELKDNPRDAFSEDSAPISQSQDFIPSQPTLQPASTKPGGRLSPGEDLGGIKTTPIRAVEAGPLFFECWVEEGQAKEQLLAATAEPTTAEESSSQCD
ncbi:DNA polymerase zeta processivity subunit [Podospora australis]|uniref:DNA polymerase zeta processivity subunit n=1 Tax=Podospora australis TaxID=1536484 RepID=A0AAN6WMU0_9PEZI|nr:DNA polymerase zeta processivity subunit [Podospora australis]